MHGSHLAQEDLIDIFSGFFSKGGKSCTVKIGDIFCAVATAEPGREIASLACLEGGEKH